MMNKLLTIVLLLNLSIGFGQNKKISFERLKAFKMSYITEKVDLDENQESVFWEIYGEYEKKIYEKCRKKIREVRKKYLLTVDSITNEEAFEAIKQINDLEHLAIKLEEERDFKLLEKFSPNTILKVHHAEYHFNRDMLNRMKKNKTKAKEE